MIEDRDENLCRPEASAWQGLSGQGGESLPAGRLALGSTIEVAWRADKIPLLLGPRPPAPFGLYMVGDLCREIEDCWRGGVVWQGVQGGSLSSCATLEFAESNQIISCQ